MTSCARGCCATQAEHYKSLVFGVKSGVETSQFDADMDSYARLRRDGVQPPRVSGSSIREKHANTVAEVEGRPEGTLGHNATLDELKAWTP